MCNFTIYFQTSVNLCPRRSSLWTPRDTSRTCIQSMLICWGVCAVRHSRRHHPHRRRARLEMVTPSLPKVIKCKVLTELSWAEDQFNKFNQVHRERRILNPTLFRCLNCIFYFRVVIGQRFGDDSPTNYQNSYYPAQNPTGTYVAYAHIQDAAGNVQHYEDKGSLDNGQWKPDPTPSTSYNNGQWTPDPTTSTTTSKY